MKTEGRWAKKKAVLDFNVKKGVRRDFKQRHQTKQYRERIAQLENGGKERSSGFK